MNLIFVFSLLFIGSISAQSSVTHSSKVVAPSHHALTSSSVHVEPSPTPVPEVKSSHHHAPPAPSTTSITPSKSMSPSSHAMTSSAVPTTTAKPTTTTKTPTTTPKPVPHFEVKDKNGTSCIYVKGNINLVVTAKSMNTTTLPLVQDGAQVSGHCHGNSSNTSDITVTWGADKHVKFMLQFTYEDKMWYMSAVMVTVNADKLNLTASGHYKASSNDKLYQASGNKSYSCQRDQNLTLVSSHPQQGNITVDFKTVQIQPFKAAGGKPFDDSMMCPATTDDSTSSSIVPIAVGCALAGLIVIVLIAYLIGRRKNNRGYQQV